MQFVCDTPGGRTWFKIDTEAEAERESRAMDHAVDKHFRRMRDAAAQSYVPTSPHFIEQEIGLKGHIERTMPLFLTLRDGEGQALVTAMLPPRGRNDTSFRPIIVAASNEDPFPQFGDAIRALGRHYGMTLEPERCYPYRRG